MKISVIIPVKNGELTLVKCLTAIQQQTIADNIEIIVLDSMSTDNSREIAARYGAKVIDIPDGTFNHGHTRQLGVEIAKGDLLYFTVQDAYLAQNDQLEKMVGHFNDEQLMAMVGMQAVPAVRQHNPALWFKRFSEPCPVFRQLDAGMYDKLSRKEQLEKTIEWDDVNAMYRRTALIEIPFAKTDFAEDKLWARDALRAAMKIGFDPSLVVYHYHHSNFIYSFKLAYTIHYYYYKHFKVLPLFPPFWKPFSSSLYQIWKKAFLSVQEKLYWSVHNFLRLSGNVVSTGIFILIKKLMGEKKVHQSFKFFCKKVPQGKSS